MELIIGEHAGFCYGVRRAVEEASRCAKEQVRCATLGPLMHNPQEVARLQAAGIRMVHAPEEAQPGETLLIRSHGVSPEVLHKAEALGIPVIDLTCPHVSHIHRLVRDAEPDRTLIILGEADHPEVQGIAGWSRAPVVILHDARQAETAPLPERAMVVAQTTIRRETFEAALEVLRRRIPDLIVHRTVCAATAQRQKEAEKLAMEADVVIVVGGRNSANTRKLAQTCQALCPRTLLAETAEEIPKDFIHPEDKVALTAGASTPQWLLQAVCDRVRKLAGEL